MGSIPTITIGASFPWPRCCSSTSLALLLPHLALAHEVLVVRIDVRQGRERDDADFGTDPLDSVLQDVITEVG